MARGRRYPERFWNRIAKNYDKHGARKRASLLGTIERIKSHLEPGDRVLDFACGTGEKALGVASRVQSVHGIDLSEKMIELASAKTKHRHIENARFSRTDLFDTALRPGSYDAIMAFYVFHLVDDPVRVFERIRELLKPDGRLVSETPCLGESGIALRWLIALVGKLGPLPNVRCYGIAELKSELAAASLRVVECEPAAENPNHLFVVARRI